jgi:glycosyltransferase involved in cell wall biosynthesis
MGRRRTDAHPEGDTVQGGAWWSLAIHFPDGLERGTNLRCPAISWQEAATDGVKGAGSPDHPMSFFRRIKTSLDPRSMPLASAVLPRLMWWRYRLFGRSHSVQSIAGLCRVARLAGAEEDPIRDRVEREIAKSVDRCRDQQIQWASHIEAWKAGIVEKAVVLKPYLGEQERGVILVSFEYQWARLMALRDLESFCRRYMLVVAPTWSPPHCLANTLFPDRYPDESIFTLISNESDLATFPRLSSKWKTIPLYASNWVDPGRVAPTGSRPKEVDIVMLANFAPYKRHHLLFDALRSMKKGVKVTLVGQSWGGFTSTALRNRAREYGVLDQIEIRESVTNEEVVKCLASAKISVILSGQEGSCVAVVESLFAGTPVGMFADAMVGSRVFINDATGKLLHRKRLGEQLQAFVDQSERYRPREWALANGIDCHGSTAILNRALKDYSLGRGDRWTKDIAVHHWAPDPRLLGQADADSLLREYDLIRSTYGLQIGTGVRGARNLQPLDVPSRT